MLIPSSTITHIVRLVRRFVTLAFACAAAACAADVAGMVVVLIGPPASGKSTQATFLNRKYKLAILDAAQLARGAAGDDAINVRVREAVTRMGAQGFVIDGYPATRVQATHLDALARELRLASPLVIVLDVPDEVVRQRMKNRAAQEKELARYHREMDLVQAYYPQADIWKIIGTRPAAEVSATIQALIEDRGTAPVK